MIDQTILLALYSAMSASVALSSTVVFFAKWFPYLLALSAAVYALTRSENVVRTLFLVFLPAAAALFAADIIKFLFPVMRPFAELALPPLILGENPTASFPSTHASIFSALGMTIFLRDKKIGAWFLVGALLVGLARIAAGVHYPLDILAGFVLGGAVAFFVHRSLLKFSK